MPLLDRLLVVDCSLGSAGPRATGFLADYGADVIWIEPPGGDPYRQDAPAAAAVLNRGKKSVVLDLGLLSDRDRLLDLVDAADVFVESWGPRRAAELGFGDDALRNRNPRLVRCSVTGFGDDGPHSDLPGYEALVHTVVGTTADQVGHRDGPIYQGLPFAGIGAAYLALIGIFGALVRREADGFGRRVSTSLLDGALAYHSMLWGENDSMVQVPGAPLTLGSVVPIRLITRSFQCADGEYLGIHTGAHGAFGRLMQVVGLADRIPPSADGMDIGLPLEPEQLVLIRDELPKIFASRTRNEWVDELLVADVCAVEHLHPMEVFDTPQAQHNGMVVRLDDPALGEVDQVAPPVRIGGAAPVVRGPAPRPGEHTDEVLATTYSVQLVPEGQPDTRPLFADLKILDLGAFYAGPYSSRLLADLGANVIKLEPTRGDQLRGLDNPFFSAQAGKRSLAADAKDPELRPAVEALLKWADVVHHNLRPGAAERLGLDYDTVRSLNPAIVYLYAPGWGSSGPFALRQSFAPMLSGYAGVTYEVAGRYNEPMPPVGNEDPGNGLLGAVGVLMALLERTRTRKGELIENPQLNATMSHVQHIVRQADGSVVGAEQLDPMQYGIAAVDRLYQTSDGWICVVARRDEEIAGLGKVLGADLLADERFATVIARAANDEALGELLEPLIGARTTAELVADLRALDVPVAVPVAERNNHAFMNDPENRRTGRVAEAVHASRGKVRELAVLVRVSDAEVPPHRAAPELGQHTDQVLAEVGYTTDKIAALRARGAVR
jgi:crotonobetainyl-CoA:carnitine CoA-transferase CaiB-like acyl-CoA transferase